VPVQRIDFSMEAGEDWVRTLVLPTDFTNANMEIRDSRLYLFKRLDLAGGKLIRTVPGSLQIHLLTTDTQGFGLGFPGVMPAINYWGIGRAYLYDLFIFNQVWVKEAKGYITVEPAITKTLQ
jgi:hypothetical protein